MMKKKAQQTNFPTDPDKAATLADVQQWQVEHIETSIRQVDAGNFVSHEEIKSMVAKWRTP